VSNASGYWQTLLQGFGNEAGALLIAKEVFGE